MDKRLLKETGNMSADGLAGKSPVPARGGLFGTPGGGAGERLRRQAGISLIEVLVAAMILGIGLVAVGGMTTYGVISHRKSANYTIAVARVTEEIERIREAGYLGAQVSTSLFPASRYTIVDSTHVSFTVADLKNGTGTITLDEDNEAKANNPATGQPYLNLKRATVQVSWGGSRNLSGSYRAATLVANRPQ